MSDDEFEFDLTEEDLRCISAEETRRKVSTGQGPKLVQTTLTDSFFNGGGTSTARQPLGYITKPTTAKNIGTLNDEAILSCPTHHVLNEEELGTYIYPTNLPIRDYQYNIVQKALFSNLLCALPTGLGKTFVASTVMLNWYRWTKTAKIIFMAPTKPLVSQQIKACLGITGMPSHDSSVLIGGALTPKKREDEWNNKRIFFATPQTVENDLKKGILDPKTIACLVVDEAHRATGNFSYVMVVDFIKRFNSSFRILALTATPSSTVEGVQSIIDKLHIARVEIRTEVSIDIRSYVHKREIERIKTEFSPDMEIILDLISNAIQPMMKEAIQAKALFITDPRKLTAFGITSSLQSYMATTVGRSKSPLPFKIASIMKILARIGHALGLLKYHGIKPFYQFMERLKKAQYETVDTNGKVKKKPPGKYMGALLSNPNYVEMENFCHTLINGNDEYLGHPKMEHLLSIMIEFFSQKSNSPDDSPSNVIIFSAYRESAGVILQALERHKPMVRPHLFIGQANTGKKSQDEFVHAANTGMTQKVQQDVVDKFKKGIYNTLVATSIGEEGLDIGEVDLIICYDASASPIRGLQRMGRTGRKRQGRIVMLLADNEDKKLDKAVDNYQYIQRLLTDTKRFVLPQADRILPANVKPVCVQKEIEIPDENIDLLKKEDIIEEVVNEAKHRKTKIAPKRKAKATTVSNEETKKRKKFNMPDNVVTGFVTASKLRHTESGNFVIDEDSDNESTTMATTKPSETTVKTTNLTPASKYEFPLNFGSDSDSDESEPKELNISSSIGKLTPISSSLRELIFSPTPGNISDASFLKNTPSKVSENSLETGSPQLQNAKKVTELPSSPMRAFPGSGNSPNRRQDKNPGPKKIGERDLTDSSPPRSYKYHSDQDCSDKFPQLENGKTGRDETTHRHDSNFFNEELENTRSTIVLGNSLSSPISADLVERKGSPISTPTEKVNEANSQLLMNSNPGLDSPGRATPQELSINTGINESNCFTKQSKAQSIENILSPSINYRRSPTKPSQSSPLARRSIGSSSSQTEENLNITIKTQAGNIDNSVANKEKPLQTEPEKIIVKKENHILHQEMPALNSLKSAMRSKTLGVRRPRPLTTNIQPKENRFRHNQFLTESQRNELEEKYASKLQPNYLDDKGRLLMGYKEYDPLIGARMNSGHGIIPHGRTSSRFFQAVHFGQTVQDDDIKRLENQLRASSSAKNGVRVKKEKLN